MVNFGFDFPLPLPENNGVYLQVEKKFICNLPLDIDLSEIAPKSLNTYNHNQNL